MVTLRDITRDNLDAGSNRTKYRSAAVDKLLDAGRFCEVRYEDLVNVMDVCLANSFPNISVSGTI